MISKGMECIRYVMGKECHAFSPQIDQDLTGYIFFCGDVPPNQVYDGCRITY